MHFFQAPATCTASVLDSGPLILSDPWREHQRVPDGGSARLLFSAQAKVDLPSLELVAALASCSL